jgi:hypothetical protein
MHQTTTTVRPPHAPKFLWCPTCDRVEELTPAHLRTFTVTWRWPTCCGVSMTVKADAQFAKETVID